MKRTLEIWLLAIGAATGISGMVGSFVLLPWRVSAVEAEQVAIRSQMKQREDAAAADHELLVRIEERTKSIQEVLGERNAKQHNNE